LTVARDGVEEKKRLRVLRGALNPLIYAGNPRPKHVRLARYVQAIGRTFPVKTASIVPETLETAQKIDIQWILA
jgi:pyrimidine operon attenuation protein/uracil phosphoribosyltransferase